MDGASAAARLTGDLERIHRSAFQGQDKLLFLMDSLEKEEAFYVYEKNMLRRRAGYYVYYEKNPQMQEYMMQGKNEREARPEIDPQRSVVTNYRAIAAEKSKKSGKGFHAFVYVASLALLVAVFAMGVNMMSSAGKIHRLEEAVSYLQADKTSIESAAELQMESDLSGEALSDKERGEHVIEDTISDTKQEEAVEELVIEENKKETLPDEPQEMKEETLPDKPQENKEETLPDETQEDEQKINEKEETEEEEEPKIQETSVFADQDYYIVQKGESLLGISQKIYGKDYTEQLCTLNELEDENKIYAGQKLLLLDK